MSHPVLSSRDRLGPYLLLWIPVAGLIAVPAVTGGCSWTEALAFALPLALLGAGMGLGPYYLAKAFPADRTPARKLLLIWSLAAIVDAALWCGGGWAAARALSGLPSLQRLPLLMGRSTLALLWVFGVMLYLACGAMYYLVLAQGRAQEAEQDRMKLQVLARDAELKALRAQLNPHFLFNSLNSISALTSLDAGRAREMCVLLSDFLRRSLGLGERESIALGEELELARNYLAIEAIRFGARLKLDWDLDPACEGAKLPPLLLQPLVENAIKHGISRLPEGGALRVSTRLEEGRVAVSVENPVDPDGPSPKGLGLGLRQVRQRLLGRFGSEAAFECGVAEQVHRARLRFPFQTANEELS